MFKFIKKQGKYGYVNADTTQRRNTLKVLEQTGKIGSLKKDASRKALLPSKRVSETGKIYWETRKNRSDAVNSDV